jgi:hypothetical protein
MASEFTEIATEVVRARCRADLVITMPRMKVVVEAKIDAFERPDQCDDLFAAFGEDLGVEFVFLTPRGRPPATATGDARRAFRRLSFAQLREALGDLLATSDRSAPGRLTVESYHTTLEAQFQ